MTINILPGDDIGNAASLAANIIDAFRTMDFEADTPGNGYATGLNWYGGWRRSTPTRP